MNEYTEVSRLAITDIPKFILAVICSFASKLFSQENDTVAKAAEEVMRAYRDINTNIEELKRTDNDTAKDTTANNTLLFDKNVATDSSLSPIDKAVYSVLCALADNEALQCSPKVETIAAKASCSPRSVQTSLNTLEKRALIRRQPRFINHRQISSLYTVIGSKAASRSVNISPRDEKNNTCEGSIQSNTSCAEEVSNTAEQNTTYFEGRNDEGCKGRNDCTQLGLQDLQSGTQAVQSEKTLLESFKDSIRGASLPALAEKDLDTISVTFLEEVTPTEETKASLTGGALLPILEEKKTKNPEDPESTTSTSGETEETPFIRAECDGTTTADTNTAVCENPVIRAKCYGTPTPEQMSQLVRHAPAPNANGEVVIPEIPEWLLKRYEEARKRYAELYKDDQPKAAEAPKKAEEAPVIPGMP
ncbi:MAG: helix-turn-helix domain-containing protein, partial [Synergistaceae bacterium]|nr:helix-turn-helix domain-containing protein [Synergistaceae bacterium]